MALEPLLAGDVLCVATGVSEPIDFAGYVIQQTYETSRLNQKFWSAMDTYTSKTSGLMRYMIRPIPISPSAGWNPDLTAPSLSFLHKPIRYSKSRCVLYPFIVEHSRLPTKDARRVEKKARGFSATNS